MCTAMVIIPENSLGKIKRATFDDQLFKVWRAEPLKCLYIAPIAILVTGHETDTTTFVLARQREPTSYLLDEL